MRLSSHPRSPAVAAGLLASGMLLLAVAAPVGADTTDTDELPCSLWGSIEIYGESVAASTPISAYIGSTVFATTSSAMNGDTSVYAIDVSADDPATAGVCEGGAEGDVVRFKVGNCWCHAVSWHSSGIKEFGISSITKAADVDGDGMMDVFTWRPDGGAYGYGVWLGALSTRSWDTSHDERFQTNWGLPGDVPLMGDMDRDGMVDIFTWRPHQDAYGDGIWLGALSSKDYGTTKDKRFQMNWGAPTDVPLMGDMDGDGMVDLFTWEPSSGTWRGALSTKGYGTVEGQYFQLQWGMDGDVPLLGDMDGDDRVDLFTWRPHQDVYGDGIWLGALSSTGYDTAPGQRFQTNWGLPGDVPLVADMDGDGMVDIFTWRPSTGIWYGALSTHSYDRSHALRFQLTWGLDGDVPLLADMDGDEKADVLTWRPSTGMWYGALSTKGYSTSHADRFQEQWGMDGDVPLP